MICTAQELTTPIEFHPFNFSYNTQHKCLICNSCRSVVLSPVWESHWKGCTGSMALRSTRTVNSTMNPSKTCTKTEHREFAKRLKALQPIKKADELQLRYIDIGEERFHIAIEGVAIVTDFWGCRCGGGCINTESAWSSHRQTDGVHDTKPQQSSWLQRPFNNLNGTWYRVYPLLPPRGNLTDAELLDIQHKADLLNHDPLVNTSIGLRYSNPFLHFSNIEGWAQRQQLSRSVLAALHIRTLGPTRADQHAYLVSGHVKRYVADVVRRFDGSDTLIRREIHAGR